MIIETSLLTPIEIIVASLVFRHVRMTHPAGQVLQYIKTSTGFGGGGATRKDVEVMSNVVRDTGASVKASGGVGCREDAVAMIRVGAGRIGASKGVKIVLGGEGEKGGY